MLGCAFGEVKSKSGLACETWTYGFVNQKLLHRKKKKKKRENMN